MGRFKQFLLESANNDDQYLELAGDPDSNKGELEKMVRDQSIKMGYDSPKVYHGTNALVYSDYDKLKWFNTGTERGGTFFSSEYNLAQQYGQQVYSVYLNINNPLEIDGLGSYWSNLSDKSKVTKGFNVLKNHEKQQAKKTLDSIRDLDPDFFDRIMNESTLSELDRDLRETDQVVKYVKRLGFDGVIFRNIQDMPTNDEFYKKVTSDVYAVYKSNQIKSADPITYDDQYNIIPLSKRFDDSTSDIRY